MSPLTTIQKVDFSKSEQYTLSIRINTDGFSFSIYNPLSDNPYTFFDLDIDRKLPLIANFKALVTNHPFLSQLYKRVNILIGDTKTIVHPLNLFNPDICQELYYFGQKLLNTNTQVCYNTLEANNLTIIYGANKILYKFLNEHFRNPRFFAQNTPLIAYYSQKSKEGNTKKMFVHIQAETMHLFCLNKGKLLLTNAFNASETSNQVYYILYIWKQLTYSQERDELFLSGNLEDKTNLLDAIKKYIANVSVLNPSEYLDLKAMNLCEL